MTDIEELIERYVSVWNEPDIDRRRIGIVALWTEDGAHITHGFEYPGYATIEARIAQVHDLFVATGAYVFRRTDIIAARDNVVRFDWQMLPANGGEPAGAGFDLLVLSEDGRIRVDYHFHEASLAA